MRLGANMDYAIAGAPAPRLGELALSPQTAREHHHYLIQQIVRTLSIGLIHGDLTFHPSLTGQKRSFQVRVNLL